MLALVLVTAVTVIAYFFLKLSYLYWEKRGIRGPKPRLFIGNLGKSAIFLEPVTKLYSKLYNEYPNEELMGFYRFTNPTLLVRDPDLIKEIEVKSFNNFHDNDVYIDKEKNPILGVNPFMLKGEEWKTTRSQLTPAFTSGKIKSMYPLLEEVSSNLVKFIDKHPETTNGEGYEAKELCFRFTLDNVASCAFGLDGKCLKEEDSDFLHLSREFFTPSPLTIMGFILIFFFPALAKHLPLRLVKPEVEKKLLSLITETLRQRKEKSIVRNDYLQILIQLRESNPAFTDVDVTAQAATFLTDGSETSSAVMSFVLYHLASTPEAQKKLREEVNAAFDDNDQKLPYEVIQSLRFLEATIYEAMRIHPPFSFIPKLCTKDFTYVPKNRDKPVMIEKGTSVVVPLWGLQRDPKYFPEPKSFKPERHLEENKDNLMKCKFLPFGDGPRQCLGRRFGMLQIKVGVAHIIRNFELSVNKKTKVPLQFVNNVMTIVEGGLWINFKKIEH